MNMNNPGHHMMINPPDLQLCIQPITTIQPHHQKKRTKMIRFHNPKPKPSPSPVPVITKKKPDPTAPKITPPCTECGKRFWSWKALFGHMRCHPERPWRGINPPPNTHRPSASLTTEEDEYVAACLLMLANTPPASHNKIQPTTSASTSNHQHDYNPLDLETRFECSSCKKVFGSHQALGGHRASHKNVKGCFAITKTDAGTEQVEYYATEGLNMNQQHKCSVCFKIFSSGQALGGHKRCHLEKEDALVPTAITFRFDLNAPAPLQDDSTCSSSDLDLGLHL